MTPSTWTGSAEYVEASAVLSWIFRDCNS